MSGPNPVRTVPPPAEPVAIIDEAGSRAEATQAARATAPLLRRVVSGGVWAFAGRVALGVFGLLLHALLARILTPMEMGAYFLALSLATFLAMLARMGMESTTVRFLAESLGQGNTDVPPGIVLRVLLLCGLGCVITGGLLSSALGDWLLRDVFGSAVLMDAKGLLALWIAMLAYQAMFAEVFRGFQWINLSVLFGGVLTAVLTLGCVAWAWRGDGESALTDVLFLFVFAGAVNGAVAFYALRRRLSGVGVRPPMGKAVTSPQILAHSFPLLLTQLMLFVMFKGDIWIVAAFRGEQEVAIYGAAARIVLFTNMMFTIVNAVLPPMLAELNAQGLTADMERLLRQTATIAALPALFLLAILIGAGGPVLRLVFGEGYQDGRVVLGILSVGQVVRVLAGSCGYTLIMTGHRKAVLCISTLVTLVAIPGAVILCGAHGARGVAAAAAIALSIQQLLMLLAARRYSGVWTHFSAAYFMGALRRLNSAVPRP